MVEILEYSDILTEAKGAMTPGRLKLTDQQIIFKNNKTGKVDQINANDIDLVNWQKLIGSWGLRIFLKNGALHRFGGFKEGEQDKIAKFFTSNYKKDMLEKEMCYKGWNWGTAKFNGSLLSFDIGNATAFEVPLNNVSQCTTGKNEVTVEFHQNDDAPVNLMEMRFHIPSSELAGEDTVDLFHQNVMSKASVINVSGDALAIFREIQCLTPRGRYDIKVFNSFVQLHGKTFDYKLPVSTVLRLFLLPHHDKRQIFFVVSLDPPIKQGQTRYHYLVCLFLLEEDETSIELPYSEEELKTKFDGKLEKELKGQTYEVLAKLMKAIVGRKLTEPSFKGKSDTPALACSYKAAAGYLYPLERGFMYVHKPPFHIRFEEIASVNFARGGGGRRSFDFEVELRTGTIHTFSSIEKDEYTRLFDFIVSKKLNVKNRGKSDKLSYNDELFDSDQDGEPDAYLARVKREAEERDDADDGGSNDGESTDEDFNPNQVESDVAEEYDSNPASTNSDEGDSDASASKKEKKPKKSAKTVSEKPRKKKKEKKAKDSNAPKRPQSAYFIWMNENREKIKEKYPKFSITEVAKKGGEMWRELKDKSEWEEKAKKAKADYEVAMKEYKESGGGGGDDNEKGGKKKKSKTNKSTTSSAASPIKSMSGSGFKSKEYVSTDSESSADEADDKKKPKKEKPKAKKKEPEGKKKKGSSSDGSGDESGDKSKKKGKSDSDGEDKKNKKGGSDDDEFPDEPDESTPATTEESGGEASSASD